MVSRGKVTCDKDELSFQEKVRILERQQLKFAQIQDGSFAAMMASNESNWWLSRWDIGMGISY